MLAKLLKVFFIGGITIVLLLVAVVGVAGYGVWYDNTHKHVLQTLRVPQRDADYYLLTDIAGFGDRAWYIYERPLGAPPTAAMLRAHDLDRVLFWNYSELGDHSGSPTLSVVRGRYLAFARGGRYYGLYDLDARRILVNQENPWAAFAQSREYRELGGHASLKNLEIAMDGWVKTYLDWPIRETLAHGEDSVTRAAPVRAASARTSPH